MADEELKWYILLDGTHSYRGKRARRGEKIQLTSQEAEKLGERVRIDMDNKTTETVKPTYEPATTTTTTTTSATVEPTTAPSVSPVNPSRDWSTTQDMKAPDVINLINDIDSKEDLVNLREVEENGQNRIGVLNAIKKKMGQIGG